MIFDEKTLKHLASRTSPSRAVLLRMLNTGEAIPSDDMCKALTGLSKVGGLSKSEKQRVLNIQLCRLKKELARVVEIETVTSRRMVLK